MTTPHVPFRPTFAGRIPYRFSVDQFRRLRDAGIVTDADEQDVLAGRYRFSVDQYHRMGRAGVFGDDERMELLDGLVVRTMKYYPPHSSGVQRTRKRIEALLPEGWTARIQDAITLPTTEPLPDIAVARGSDDDYLTRQPGPADLGLVVEVADSSLPGDRGPKSQLYAAAGIVEYWIVNLIDRQVEVMTQPTATGYTHATIYPQDQAVPLTLDGTLVGPIAVSDLLP
jgi:Uma2 family endonuclease